MRAGASVNEVEVVPLPLRIDAMHRKLNGERARGSSVVAQNGCLRIEGRSVRVRGASRSRKAVAIASKYGTFALEVVARAWKDRACALEGLACASEDLVCALKSRACALNALSCGIRGLGVRSEGLGVRIEGARVRLGEQSVRTDGLGMHIERVGVRSEQRTCSIE
jgi:hypothetical protein